MSGEDVERIIEAEDMLQLCCVIGCDGTCRGKEEEKDGVRKSVFDSLQGRWGMEWMMMNLPRIPIKSPAGEPTYPLAGVMQINPVTIPEQSETADQRRE